MQIAYSNISTLFCGEMVFRDTPRRVLFELVLPLPRHWPGHCLCSGMGVTLLVFTPSSTMSFLLSWGSKRNI